jgi:hypothetical protein
VAHFLSLAPKAGLVMLPDPRLLPLPLEALAALQTAGIHAARDFSLHVLLSRLAKAKENMGPWNDSGDHDDDDDDVDGDESYDQPKKRPSPVAY